MLGVIGEKTKSLAEPLQKKGLDNFDKQLEKYEAAKSKYKSLRQNSGNKSDINKAKQDYKQEKRLLDRDYKQIKKDYQADKGKNLYSSGKTITGNSENAMSIQAGVVIGASIANRVLRGMGNQRLASIASSTIAVGGTAVNVALATKTVIENRQLRAYYGHGR